jgi:hypothetical protein
MRYVLSVSYGAEKYDVYLTLMALDIAMTLSLTRPYPDPTLYRVGSGRLKYL